MSTRYWLFQVIPLQNQNDRVLGLCIQMVREAVCAANILSPSCEQCPVFDERLQMTLLERENTEEHKKKELESYETCRVWLSPVGLPGWDALIMTVIWLFGG